MHGKPMNDLRAGWSRLIAWFSPKYEAILDLTVRKARSERFRLIEMLVIKCLYVLLCVSQLRYRGYHGRGYDIYFVWWKELLSTAAFMCLSLLHLRMKFPGKLLPVIMKLLHYLYFLPLNCAFGIHNMVWPFFWETNLYYLLILLAVYGMSHLWEKRFPVKNDAKSDLQMLENKLLNMFCLAVCGLYIVHKLSYNGLEFSLTLGNEIYADRAGYQAYLDGIAGSLFSYLLAIVRYLVSYVSAFYLLSGLLRRKWLPITVSILCVLCQFSVAAQKAQLLMMVMVVILYMAWRLKLLEHLDRLIPMAVLALLLVCVVEKFLLKRDDIFMLLVRRQMYIPSWMNALYYDFFWRHDKIHWTQSTFLLQNILQPVYEKTPLEIISKIYFKGGVPSPNTGMFGDAYMHFGSVGAVIYPPIIGIMLTVTHSAYRRYGSAIGALIACQLLLNMTNVPLLRTDFVLSHGLFTAALCMISLIDLDAVFAWMGKKLKRKTNE